MLKIQAETLRDLMVIPCSEVGRGSTGPLRTDFVIHRVDAIIPDAFDAIVILGDMQAMDSHFIPVEDRTLLGVCVAHELGTYCGLGLWPSPERVLICLTGDLFTVASLDKRGGTGDVISVYRAFAKYFPHVVAVAGNHDLFGEGTSIATAEKTGVRVLNGTQIQFGEFTVGGICGIAGDNGKVWRNTKRELKQLVQTAAKDADLLLVHEPPKLDGYRGNQDLSDFLAPMFDGVVAAGHVGWDTVIANSEFGKVFNLEGRGIVLAMADAELTV